MYAYVFVYINIGEIKEGSGARELVGLRGHQRWLLPGRPPTNVSKVFDNGEF